MIRRSFKDLLKSVFIPSYEALVRLHLEYSMPACSQKPRRRYQRSRVISKISYKFGNWHANPSYEERLQQLGLAGIWVHGFPSWQIIRYNNVFSLNNLYFLICELKKYHILVLEEDQPAALGM